MRTAVTVLNVLSSVASVTMVGYGSLSVRSIARSGALAAIRTGISEPGREAAGSTRRAGALQRR
jgi:hypothetical protein